MKYLTSFLASLLLGVAVHAATPSRESVEKLLVATNVEKQLLAMHAQIENLAKGAMDQALQGQTLSPEAQQLAETRRVKMVADFKQEMNWDSIKEIYLQAYTENFTQEEVDGLVAFYQTVAGQAFIQKMPQIMQKANGQMQQRMKPAMMKMQQTLKETADEVKGQKKADTPTFSIPPTPAPKG